MPLIDLVLTLRWVEGGVAAICGSYYLFTLLFKPPDIAKGGRRGFTKTIGALLLSFGIDGLVSARLGGPVAYLQAGGWYGPVVVVIIARSVTILSILLLVLRSWKTWKVGSSANATQR